MSRGVATLSLSGKLLSELSFEEKIKHLTSNQKEYMHGVIDCGLLHSERCYRGIRSANAST